MSGQVLYLGSAELSALELRLELKGLIGRNAQLLHRGVDLRRIQLIELVNCVTDCAG